MPWYMSHYCDSLFAVGVNDVQDSVCYGDYFSPMNAGFNATGKGLTDWPNSQAFSVFPNNPQNFCAPGTTPPLTTCTIAMAGFDLADPVSSLDPTSSSPTPTIQYQHDNANLLNWFNSALQKFKTNFSMAELERHFPWSGTTVTWASLYPQARSNPFLGRFTYKVTANNDGPGCVVGQTGPSTANCQPPTVRADHFLYPRECNLTDLAATDTNVTRLRQCGLSFELHPNGFLDQWPYSFWPKLPSDIQSNQYGRTSFLLAGVPGMQMPVSYYKDPSGPNGLSVYEQVDNASLFSLYLPIANEADVNMAFTGRNYTDDFYHTLLMSNHMESDPTHFTEGVRGKVLWHDEYRSKIMYAPSSPAFPDVTFPAAFNPMTAPSPYHNHTCDGCHVRNGSGIPINTTKDSQTGLYNLDATLQEFMTATYSPYKKAKDYTFTGEILPMKLVFFDLGRAASTMSTIDDSVYSKPLLIATGPGPSPHYYSNKIMNFYGDSFHVTRPGYSYTWQYAPIDSQKPLLEVVDKTERKNCERGNYIYPLWQVNLTAFQTPSTCSFAPLPNGVPADTWPQVKLIVTRLTALP